VCRRNERTAPLIQVWLAYAYGISGHREAATKLVKQLEALRGDAFIGAHYMAVAYAASGIGNAPSLSPGEV
jgi:hypothetical protein